MTFEGGNIRIVVVDDYGPWRAIASSILKREPGIQLIAEAGDGFEAVHRAVTLSPDVILMDIAMPGLNGIDAARQIREIIPSCKILFFSELRSADIAETALRVEGSGYVVKFNAASELVPALKAVLAGERYISALVDDPGVVLAVTGVSNREYPAEANPFMVFGHSTAIQELLASVIDGTRADFGTIQLFDSSNCALKIVAQYGFQTEFLKHFDVVDHTCDCPCARAMKTRLRVIVTEVSSDPIVSTLTRRALLRANVLSLQATPIIGWRESLVGVVTTHYARPGGPSPEVLPTLDDLTARFVANISS